MEKVREGELFWRDEVKEEWRDGKEAEDLVKEKETVEERQREQGMK